MPFDNEFTIGIEEEFQIIDPQTRELRSRVNEILEEGQMLLGEQVKPEMHQSMIEVGTGICRDVKEARQDVIKLRRGKCRIGAPQGIGNCRGFDTSDFTLGGSAYHRKRAVLPVD